VVIYAMFFCITAAHPMVCEPTTEHPLDTREACLDTVRKMTAANIFCDMAGCRTKPADVKYVCMKKTLPPPEWTPVQ
jgi:hypothetical protein